MTLDSKTRELVAVGASITANCQPCLEYHANKAIEFGADAAEIADAIEMGKRVRKGAGAKMDEFSSALKTSGTAPKGSVKPFCCG